LPAGNICDIRTLILKKPLDIPGLRRKLTELGQTHVLRFYESLDQVARQNLIRQLQGLDYQNLAELVEQYVRNTPAIALPTTFEPVPAYPRIPDAARRPMY